MNNGYQAIADEYFDLIASDSNQCVFLGIDKDLDRLPDPSEERIRSTAEKCRILLEKIDRTDTDNLTFDEKLDLKIAGLAVGFLLNKNTRLCNGRPEYQQLPMAGEEITYGIFCIFINDPRPASIRLNDILGRVRDIPGYLAKYADRLEKPVARWAKIDLEMVGEIPGFLKTLKNWGEKEEYSKLKELERAIEHAETSIGEYMRILKAMPKTNEFAVGYEEMCRIIRLRGIRQTPEELRLMAARFIGETKEQLDAITARLVAKYSLPESSDHKNVHRFLNEKFRVSLKEGAIESVLDRYQTHNERILEFVQSRKLFPIPKSQDMQVIRTPPFMEPTLPAGAMMPPPPFREGKRVSTVYLTLKEDQLDEHTELGIPIMMIHEGIPGHHLHLATAGQNRSLFRKTFDAADQAEGWATMMEDYMLDVGYMEELKEECRFSAKREISRLAARVAIDLYFMSGEVEYLDIGLGLRYDSDDVFANAAKLLKEVTGFTDGRVQAELNWYSYERGYPLSYLTGNRLVWELKNDLKAAQKGKMERLELDRTFHKIFLEAGNVPVALLRELFEHKGLLSSDVDRSEE